MNQFKQKAIKKWTPVLENMGVNKNRLEWMSEYAELHSVNESASTSGVAYANAGNVAGMGNVSSAQPAAIPGVTIGTSGDQVGSGDYGQQLLPVAMKIAAQTIGLDLVPVKPTPGPKVDLLYIDFQYDNTPDNDCENPLVFKMNIADDAEKATFHANLRTELVNQNVVETVGGLNKRVFLELTGTVNTVAGDLTNMDTNKEGILEFLGFSRIDGLPMFRSFRQTNETSSQGHSGWGFNATLNTFDHTDSIVDVLQAGFVAVAGAITVATVELISALEDHIPGYVSNFESNNAPMRRGTDDDSYPGIIAPSLQSKTIEVGTIQISSALRRTEIEDIKANTGMDIAQKMESILVNELSQTISKQIVGKLFEMGDLNAASVPAGQFDFDVDAYLVAATAPGGENAGSLQRKLVTKILTASYHIATEGRVGPATFVVTNGRLAAALQDVAAYTPMPLDHKINGAGQLYPVGQIGGISVYVDPYMRTNDNRILVGRKNAADQPGIVFCPYLMAQSISLMSEATFAPRILLRSRYAIAELGWYPQKQYLTISVTDSLNRLS